MENSLEGLKNRSDFAESSANMKLDWQMMQSEEHLRKTWGKWGSSKKRGNTIKTPAYAWWKGGERKILKEIIVGNSPKLVTNSSLHIKAQQDSGWINTKRTTPRYIIVKMWKAKDNFLKASRNNNLIQVLVSFTSELSSKTLEARGGGKVYPKGWKETGADPKPGIRPGCQASIQKGKKGKDTTN